MRLGLSDVKLRPRLMVVGLVLGAVLTGCRLDEEIVVIAVENRCGQAISIRIDNRDRWTTIDEARIGGGVQSGVDENGEMAPALALDVAIPSNQDQDPTEWVSHSLTHNDLALGGGTDSGGSDYEAIITIEGDLCP